jgi:hypothetical protein
LGGGGGGGGGEVGLDLDPLLIAPLKKNPNVRWMASTAARAVVSNIRNERLADL